ncbi:MAG: heterodisulfide reductase-related iron-sulfur binding cluster [Candidatus Rokubacteria bacterium]|nr:heterodisulfide reductase-related iron-sulfur binding cluster [Candidatus Rokubacteria bacterium]
MSVLLTSDPREGNLLRAIEENSGQNVFSCYQCGKCTAGCPFSLSPQQVVRLLQLGQVDEALRHATTWDCASCLTCATACPKGVSPARIQKSLRMLHRLAEDNGHAPLDRDYRAHARPLRTFLFANIEPLSRVGSALAPVSNWALQVPGAKLVADRILGIHKNRSLPPFVRHTFPEWFKTHTPLGDAHRGTVLLFHDTFMDFNYPSTGIAVTELLETAGFRVELADKVCCGRPMISKGLLSQAATQARTNVTRLYEQARHGAYIVGCEPSCLLTLREEYPELVEPELREKARVVARQAVLIDEFLGMLNDKGELGLTFRESEGTGREVIFHGHCHQKAAADPARSVELLRLAGYQAEMADAPCCGMAGAYGYEKEHYEASRAAGERNLFPLIRANAAAQVAVMGTSCRQQVEHFTGRRARHMVELLREAVL